MRISNEWLREFVSLPPDDELDALFEMAGLGVEEHKDDVWALEVTSNRGDCLCALGLAREVAAMSQARLRFNAPILEDGAQVLEGVHIRIESADDCPQYLARVIEGVSVGPSPDWMQARLIAGGMRPINAVVDVTNYVMLELGQPLHAFDAATLRDAEGAYRIEVRRARVGETLQTLDGAERTLGPQVLVIADASRAIAVAGVMGGAATEVKDSTRSVLLEAAVFNASVVRRGKRLLDLPSEASRRFERGIDALNTRRALDRAAQLLAEIAGGSIREGVAQNVAQPFEPRTVELRVARCNQVLGLGLGVEEMAAALERLGFEVRRGEAELQARVPSWRRDIEREIDLIEEVARVHGYNRVPSTLPRTANETAGRSLPHRLQEKARELLGRCGLSEVVTYSLESAGASSRAGLEPRAAVRLRNPLSEDYAVLRTSLLPSLLGVLERNARLPVRLFELAKIYIPRDEANPEAEQPDEVLSIGIALLDAPAPANWQKKDSSVDFFTLKAMVQNVLHGMGCPDADFHASSVAPFQPGRCAVVSIEGQEVGVLGQVHPQVAARYELSGRAYLAQLDFESLVRHAAISVGALPIARFPASERDIALIVRDEVPASRVQSVLREAGGQLLEAVEVFDVYKGAPIEPGSKSLALSLRFRSPERTLTEEEVQAAMERVQSAARESLGASLRA